MSNAVAASSSFKQSGFTHVKCILSALIIGLAFALWGCAEAAPVILSQDGDYNEPLAQYSSVLIDPSGEMTLDALRLDRSSMVPYTNRYVDFGLNDAQIWLRTSLKNPSQKSHVWRLDLRRQFVSSLDVYVVRAGEAPINILTHTNRDSFAERPIPNRYLAVDIPIEGQETVEVYVTYRSDAATWLPYKIATQEAYIVAHGRENSINWLMNGSLFAVLVLALILAPVVRWQISAAFSVYIISGSLFVFNSEGYAFQYFWPNAPGLNDPIDLVFILMMAASGPAFGRVFFDVQRHSPFLNKVLLTIVTTALVLATLTFPLFDFAAFKLLAYPLVVISSVLHFAVAIFAFRRKLPGSTPIVIGACFVLGSLLYALVAGIVPGKISLEHTLDIGHITLLIESIAFAVAIAIRLNRVRLDRNRALISELDSAREKANLNAALLQSQNNYDAARELARARRDELASVRHDIAQPLTSLRAAMSDLEGVDEGATKQMHASFDYLETIAREGAYIDRTTGNGPGKDNKNETFMVTAILDNVVAIFSGDAKAKGLELRYRPSEATIETDPLELMRMISNLVSNAIKYTESGTVLVSAHRRAGKLEIGVRDTGIGMDEQTLRRRLTKYDKGPESDGQGLGLHLVSETAECLGIQFQVYSREGTGTSALLSMAEAQS